MLSDLITGLTEIIYSVNNMYVLLVFKVKYM